VSDAPFIATHISDIKPVSESEPGEAEWKPVRHHFGIHSFGTNAFVAAAEGDQVVEEHTEVDDSGTEHEELYFVSSGRATFIVGGETVDASAGTFVFVRDPAVKRSARAREAGTIVLAFGGTPGTPFAVSRWERRHTGA
jgi:hypothetical protein